MPQFAVKLVLVTLVAALATGADGVGNGVGVGVGVGIGVGVGLGLAGAAERLPSTIRPHAAAAKHAITMSRLISRKKAWRLCLRLVSPDAAKRPAPREENTTFH